MTTLSFLQIGDIHYPQWGGQKFQLDDKDGNLSARVKGGLTPSPIRMILEKLSDLALLPSTEAIAFMGDFTSYGLPDPLRAALHHFSWLCKNERELEAQPKLLLVPGNHDVSKFDAKTLGQSAKFSKLSKWSKEALWYPVPIDNPVKITLGKPTSGRVHVFLLNTTLGSWEKYLLHGPMRSRVEPESGHEKAQPDPSQLNIPVAGTESFLPADSDFDQLDTPYVSAASIQRLRSEIDAISKRDAVVVVGHHNLLPQEVPRLSAYAELLNAGLIRRFLLSLGRPIVYLHGHTHVDMVEEIRDPRDRRARVLTVSAPQLSEGFNAIHVHFDSRGGAIGIRVAPWRISADRASFGSSANMQAVASLESGAAVQPSSEARSIFGRLKPGGRYNTEDVRELMTGSYQMPDDHLSSALLELFFWGWIEIENTARDDSEWRIHAPAR